MEGLAANGVGYLFFVDNNFNIPGDHARALCRRLADSWEAYVSGGDVFACLAGVGAGFHRA